VRNEPEAGGSHRGSTRRGHLRGGEIPGARKRSAEGAEGWRRHGVQMLRVCGSQEGLSGPGDGSGEPTKGHERMTRESEVA